MQPNPRHRLWKAILSLTVCIVAIAGCGRDEVNTTGDTGDPSQIYDWNTVEPDPDLSEVKPDFTLSSIDFAADCKKTGEACNAKYHGKVIELSGRIVGIEQNASQDQFFELAGSKHSSGDSLDNIICFPKERNQWLKATPGQTVKLRGRWGPVSGPNTLILVNCAIIEVAGDPCPRMTAEELAKEFDADPEGVNKKYQAKNFLILEGEIAKKETNEYGAVGVDFKHSGKCKITCGFTAFEKDQTKTLTVGQKILVIGQFTSFSVDESSIELYFCILFIEE